MKRMSIKSSLLILLCCLALFFIARSVDGEDVKSNVKSPAGGGEDGDGSSAPASGYLYRIKAAAGWAQSYFVPPGLNFFTGGATKKAADKIIDGVEEGGGGGSGERVKEAVARSIEKGKETMENTAKSAARMATKTAHEAKEKVKRTISDAKTAEVKVSDYEDDDEL
ncbi:unnamed protein product [Linum tenue]|uniref:Uncharacterized protein n=1 Tax=Linum tenue TaxID=586396 RepID=A0AAV0JKE8_9ROSI|nr:unnamed protein product [Linum tenue]